MTDRQYVRHLDRKDQWVVLAETAEYEAKKLADLYGVSLRTLERYFEKDFARNPQEWLNEQRMIVARKFLLSGKSVKETSIELGFKQFSHFSKVFKKTHGVTPSYIKKFAHTCPKSGFFE